jgi:hypothetical protein
VPPQTPPSPRAQPQTRYEPDPTYPTTTGRVRTGWAGVRAAYREVPGNTGAVLAVDGPMSLDWDRLVAELPTAFGTVDMRDEIAAWEQVRKRTASVADLAGDPDFATLAGGRLADLFDELPVVRSPDKGIIMVYGPGAALVPHDVLWYADRPKRYAEAEVKAGLDVDTARNLGQRAGHRATLRRLFYVDWPLLDRHRDELGDRIDVWLDLQDPAEPAVLDGPGLRATLETLARRPVRTRPTFNTTSWGGHWAQETLGMNRGARNTALGYELIAPESGILLGRPGATVEVPFQLMVAMHPVTVLGAPVHETFGTSFPIRFDYLDTLRGGNLSVHCHPRPQYMRDVFGWPYTQHETYYVMVGSPGNVVFLGLHEGVDVPAFERRAHAAHDAGEPFDIGEFVQSHPAHEHQLFLIPAGTPHGSGVGNVVLEVSATPYLYSLRFYDWLRRDSDGRQRPVHVDHAFRNLDRTRTGAALRAELIQPPRTVVDGDGWREDVIGALPEMFFVVHRLELDPGSRAAQRTEDRFHVLNVVAGEGAVLDTGSGQHTLAFAETLVVPAAVGRYTVSALGSEPVRIVKAYVG